MSCCDTSNSIVLVRGDDTNYNNQQFLTLRLNTTVLDLSNSSARLTLGDIVKTYDNISSGVIEVNYTGVESSTLPEGKLNGVLRIYDNLKRRATIESYIPFYVISNVSGNAIATRPFEMTINVEQGGQNILNIDVEAGVTVEVGTTTTLPTGEDAYVVNSGTPTHLVLDFGIPANRGPQGPQGEQGEPGQDGKDGKDAMINGHNAIALVPGTGIAIEDDDGNIVISNTQTSAEWGNITGNLDNQYDLQQALAGKQPVISDLSEIRAGAEKGATSLQPDDVINNTSSSDTDKPLSANMGKSLQDQIDNLSARGRFLALWNCATGLAQSNPPESPYTYKSGDYFIVGTVASGSGTNYRPNGPTYTTGVASTTVETAEVSVDDVYYYDGENWRLQVNTQKTLAFANIAGDPYDNANLASALNAKQDELVQGTGITIDSDTNTISNSGVRSVSTGSTNGTISVNTNGTSAEVAVKGLGTAAYTPTTDYATAAQGGKADSAVQDVQVNGSSVTMSGVANIPKATSSSLGVIAVGSGLAIQSGNGSVYIVAATESNLINKLNASNPVVSTNLNIAVREGLGNNNLTWTDAYKTSARNTIGATRVSFVDWTD